MIYSLGSFACLRAGRANEAKEAAVRIKNGMASNTQAP
jgi:hypothetical protein